MQDESITLKTLEILKSIPVYPESIRQGSKIPCSAPICLDDNGKVSFPDLETKISYLASLRNRKERVY